MNTIAAALVKAKKAFGKALKDKNNPAFKSKYADLGACLEAVEGPLLDNGIFLYQETAEDSTGVTVETVFLHESGEALRGGRLHVPASKQDPQGYGSALTYCRRYSLMAACGIAPEDDDGNAASKPPARQEPKRDAKQPDPLAVALDAIKNAATKAAAVKHGEAAWELAETDEQYAQITAAVKAWKPKAEELAAQA